MKLLKTIGASLAVIAALLVVLIIIFCVMMVERPIALSSDRYLWLPPSAKEVVARALFGNFLPDGTEIVTLQFAEKDLPALKSHFAEHGSASWVNKTWPRGGHPFESEMRQLGFSTEYFPSKFLGTFEHLRLPSEEVLINTTQHRMWYMIIRS